VRGEAARVRRELGERIYLDSRRHGVVLVPALARAFLIAATGGFLFSLPWPSLLAGTALVVAAALLALRAVWRWERTHVIMTDDQLALVRGTLRRRTAAVRLERVGAVEVRPEPGRQAPRLRDADRGAARDHLRATAAERLRPRREPLP
jgi:uncharacterized membrane protein YdbT with pleckstrin-like domain